MTTTASIAELQHAGVTLKADEAVAITQQLIQTLRHGHDGDAVEPPYGPPTAANVLLNADGSVSCSGCGTTPAISEIAIFLDALLPPGSPRVPGGVRYIIARGLLEVDVAPFDSIDEFSQALARHERGPREEVIGRLLQRAESACAAAAGRNADRRRAGTTELRRALREADARLYAHQQAAMPPSGGRPFGAPRRSWRSVFGASGGGPIAPPPVRPRAVPAIAVCIASGLMLITAGQFMHDGPAKTEPAPVVIPATQVQATPVQPVHVTQVQATSRLASDLQVSAGRTTPPPRPALPRPASGIQPASRAADSGRPVPRIWPEPRERSRRLPAKRAARSSTTISSARAPRPGIMDRLRLRWLRTAMFIRSNEL